MSRPRMYGTPLVWSLAVVAVLGLIAWVVYSQGQRLDEQGKRLDETERRRVADVTVLSDQVRSLGGVPKVSPPPSPAPVTPGRDGRDGADGRAPTQGEIADAVARYLRENPPRNGRNPTMGEILTAVTGYLTENPPPAGPAGADGKDGVDGADGADGKNGTDGDDAPPPSDEQVRSAVAAFFASHTLTCTPEGPAGGVVGGPFRCSVDQG